MGRSHSLCVLFLFFAFVYFSPVEGANFSVVYSGKVYLHMPQNYTYILTGNNTYLAVRAHISAFNVSEIYPLIAIFKQQTSVLSFPLPLVINNRFSYNSVSRTLCPSFISLGAVNSSSEQIIVELSSSMPDEALAPLYRLQLDVLKNFRLQLRKETKLSITPSSPQYFLFTFPDNVDSVLVRVHSSDMLCMTISVQAAKCPVADILDTVKYSGVYQTVTTLGAITLNKVEQNITEFLVVLVLKPEDIDCGGTASIIRPGNISVPRVKNLTIIVTPTLTGYHFYLPIYGAVGIYFMFYVAAALIIFLYRSYDKHVRYYFNSFAGLRIPADRRNVANSSPPPQSSSIYGNQQCSTTLSCTHLPVAEDATTRPRRLAADLEPDIGTTQASSPQNPTSILTSAAASYQRPSPIPHSLFSSSSSSLSDFNDADANSIHMQLTGRHKVKKTRRPSPNLPLISHAPPPILQQLPKLHHKRSLSYGSTRDMGLKSGPQVEQCSACSRISLGVEGRDGSVRRPLTPVRQVEEGLEVLPDLQGDVDLHGDNEKRRHIYLHSRVLFVSDLARKRYSTLDRKYLLYFWYLIIISIFYGLPVVQLVMTYQRALHDTGNEDICYYNFECAHPLGVFTAFNNIISNIGYVMLGLLFLGLTARRDLMHRRSKKFGAHYAQLFCWWLCSRKSRNSSASNTGVASNDVTTEGRQDGPSLVPTSSPAHSQASSSIPVITVSRSRSRRLITRLCSWLWLFSYCDGVTQGIGDSFFSPNGNASANGKDHQVNDGDIEEEGKMTHGIPQHYGLFYAMGLALTMEGLLSACYHICPSFSNFQFDTAYMYILALILMLKIYQTRHPDINASAHSAYMVMAVVILAGVTGVLYGGETFWVVFTIVFLTMSIWLTAEIYYMGQWNFDICLPRRLYHLMRSDGIHCLTPMYMERMLLLLVANCVNIGIAAFGLFTRPRDFSSFLLSIFMINLLMYFFFYVIMKCRFRERFHCIPLIYLVLACLTWGAAIYFFIQHSATWEVTPAQSRALNQPCILLGFYDVHDVWHFLSSTSMFFSFMSIMTLDDDLTDTPRNKIPVF